MRELTAGRDPRLQAQVKDVRLLRYDDGADALLDRPAHARAASAVVRVEHTLLVVQDDALHLARVEADGRVMAIALPAEDGVRLFDKGRGNKAGKADLEAACLWPGAEGALMLGLGSGSSPKRERILVLPLSLPEASPRFLPAPALYRVLRELLPGAELNVEGAWRTPGGDLRVLQRGNGRGGIDAAIDLDGAWLDRALAGLEAEAPGVRGSLRLRLGELLGTALSLTDGLPCLDGRWLFSAAAEASPDAIEDGPVTGSCIGWSDDRGASWAPVCGPDGALLPLKVEGIAPGARPGEIVAVTDPDDPLRPAELLVIELRGPWPELAG